MFWNINFILKLSYFLKWIFFCYLLRKQIDYSIISITLELYIQRQEERGTYTEIMPEDQPLIAYEQCGKLKTYKGMHGASHIKISYCISLN